MARPGLARTVGTLAFGALLTLLVAELAVRVLRVPPRRAVFDEARYGPFETQDGVVLWDDRGGGSERGAVLRGEACDPDGAFRVMIVGDSILNGIDLPVEQVASVRLARRLEADHPGLRVCVTNLAVPGFSLVQGLVRARERLEPWPPHLVVLELWGGPPVWPVRVGSRVYLPHGLAPDALGLPNPYGLPPSANHAGLRASRLYELLVLAAPDDCPACRASLGAFEAELDAFVALVRAGGGEVVTVMPARLTDPFDAQVRVGIENQPWETWVAKQGLRNVRLWEAWAHEAPATLALDPVHLNARGHALLTDVLLGLAEPVLQRFELTRPPPDDATPR